MYPRETDRIAIYMRGLNEFRISFKRWQFKSINKFTAYTIYYIGFNVISCLADASIGIIMYMAWNLC